MAIQLHLGLRGHVKRFISAALSVSVFMSIAPLGVSESLADVNDSICDLVGSGTERDSFQIASKEDLLEVSDCQGPNVYFSLSQDIVLPDVTDTQPFGDSFEGHLDGRGYTIEGSSAQMFTSYDTDPDAAVLAFWGEVQGDSSIRNLTISNYSVRPLIDASSGVVFGSATGASLEVDNVRMTNVDVTPQGPKVSSDFPQSNVGYLIGEIENTELKISKSFLMVL